MADDSKDKNCPTIVTCRQAFTQNTFDATFVTKTEVKRRSPKNVLQNLIRKKCPPSKQSCGRQLEAFFPVINVLRYYRWKKEFPTDALSGLWCTCMHIPMGLAFTLLASVPPVYGIYSALFPVFVYFIFGGSRHVSVHVMAVVALMVGIVVQKQVLLFQPPSSLTFSSPSYLLNTSTLSTTPATSTEAVTSSMFTNETADSTNPSPSSMVSSFNVEIAVSVTLLAGLFQILASFLQLGKMLTNIPLPFINGFLLGASCHVVVNLLPSLLGLNISSVVGRGALPVKVVLIFSSLLKVNVAAAINGLCCLIFLIVTKEVINVRFKNKLLIPIPAELIVVIACSIVSHFAKLHNRFEVNIVSTVPRGLPMPHIPHMTGVTSYIVDAFLIAIVSYTITLYLAKRFAAKYQYAINANHELFAHALTHAVGSLFGSFAGAASSPICDTQKDTRGSGPMVSLLSCCFTIAVCLFAGPLLQPLPISTLAAVGIVALVPIFKQVTELPLLWRLNKLDIVTWTVTWLAVVFVDVFIGGGIGVAFTLTALTLQHQAARGQTLANAKGTEIYVASNSLESAAAVNESGILVFYFNANLIFANAEIFKEELFRAIREAVTLKPGRSVADIDDNDVTTGTGRDGGRRASSLALANSVDDLDQTADDVTGRNKTKNNNEGDECSSSSTASDPLIDTIKDAMKIKDSESSVSGNKNVDVGADKLFVVSVVEADQNGNAITVETSADKLQLQEGEREVGEGVGVLHTVVIDCSAISFIDIVGLNMLCEVSDLVEGQGQRLVLAQCTPGLLRQVKAAEVKFFIYPTVHDAITFERHLQIA